MTNAELLAELEASKARIAELEAATKPKAAIVAEAAWPRVVGVGEFGTNKGTMRPHAYAIERIEVDIMRGGVVVDTYDVKVPHLAILTDVLVRYAAR